MKKVLSKIDIDYAHKKAIQLVPEFFFWDCTDELAPFGSDEGYTALLEFRIWRRQNKNQPVYKCIKGVIEALTEKPISQYNKQIIEKQLVKSQIENQDFDDEYYLFTVDISVIATGFGQLVDEGKIDEKSKPFIQLAIDRQRIWANLRDGWNYSDEYIGNLNVLERVLKDI